MDEDPPPDIKIANPDLFENVIRTMYENKVRIEIYSNSQHPNTVRRYIFDTFKAEEVEYKNGVWHLYAKK